MIKSLDLNFLNHSQAIGSYLIETSAGPLLIETGPHSTIKTLEAALRENGYELSDIKHVFLTHIHLDHAGAAWVFAEKGAKIYLHPFGATHMEKPAKLMESARRIYQEKMDMLWGEMRNIDQPQLITVAHGDKINIGDKTITAWHTPGHAKHHIAWQLDNVLFTGDVAGVKIKDGPVVPPCPPPDINLEDWNDSLQLIREISPEKLYLTHFGDVSNVEAHLESLHLMLNDWAFWIKENWEAGKSVEELTPLFSEYTKKQLIELEVSEADTQKYEAANPSWMSVAGLIRYWKKKSDSQS
ncbi:MAG: MBL fold metallo-hydrolase [Cyclobacteriaceae bacterium]